MSTHARNWFAACATLGLTAGTLAAVVLWLLVTRPFAVAELLASWR